MKTAKAVLIVLSSATCCLVAWGASRVVNQAQYIRSDEFWSGDPESIGWMMATALPIGPAVLCVIAFTVAATRLKRS